MHCFDIHLPQSNCLSSVGDISDCIPNSNNCHARLSVNFVSRRTNVGLFGSTCPDCRNLHLADIYDLPWTIVESSIMESIRPHWPYHRCSVARFYFFSRIRTPPKIKEKFTTPMYSNKVFLYNYTHLIRLATAYPLRRKRCWLHGQIRAEEIYKVRGHGLRIFLANTEWTLYYCSSIPILC